MRTKLQRANEVGKHREKPCQIQPIPAGKSGRVVSGGEKLSILGGALILTAGDGMRRYESSSTVPDGTETCTRPIIPFPSTPNRQRRTPSPCVKQAHRLPPRHRTSQQDMQAPIRRPPRFIRHAWQDGNRDITGWIVRIYAGK